MQARHHDHAVHRRQIGDDADDLPGAGIELDQCAVTEMGDEQQVCARVDVGVIEAGRAARQRDDGVTV